MVNIFLRKRFLYSHYKFLPIIKLHHGGGFCFVSFTIKNASVGLGESYPLFAIANCSLVRKQLGQKSQQLAGERCNSPVKSQ